MDLQKIIRQALEATFNQSEEMHGECACLSCVLRREGKEMQKNTSTTLQQIEDNELDESSAMLARMVAEKLAEYKTEMYERAAASATRLGYPAFAKAYGILVETRRKLGEIVKELHAERDAKQEAMDAADPQPTPEEEPFR